MLAELAVDRPLSCFSDGELKRLDTAFGTRIGHFLNPDVCPLVAFLGIHPPAHEAFPRCIPNHSESVHDLLLRAEIPPSSGSWPRYDILITEVRSFLFNVLGFKENSNCKRYGHRASSDL